MLTATLISRFEELDSHGEEWDRLWSASPGSEVFSKRDWQRAWWRAYGSERELCATVVKRNGEVIGIWPMCRQGKVITPVGAGRSDYNDILCMPPNAPEVMEASLSALSEAQIPWRCISIENVAENSRLARAASMVSSPWSSRVLFGEGLECSSADFRGNKTGFIEELTGNKHLKRKEHRLSRFGPIVFDHIEGREEILSQLPGFFEQHIGRRALAGENSMFSNQRERNFYNFLVEEMDPSADLRFGVLKAGETVIAYHLGFETNGKYLCYKPTFDAEYSKWSPGEVLFRNIFLYVAGRGLRECDFTVGSEGFKERFSNVKQRNLTIRIFRTGLGAKTGMFLDSAKATVKKQPWLYEMLNRVRSRCQSTPSTANS